VVELVVVIRRESSTGISSGVGRGLGELVVVVRRESSQGVSSGWTVTAEGSADIGSSAGGD